MGNFVLNLESTPTVEGLLNTAKGNLELYKEEKSNGNDGYEYLLDFAMDYIEQAHRLTSINECKKRTSNGEDYYPHMGYSRQ